MRSPPLGVDERVGVAVDHERGHVERRRRPSARLARRDDGEQLPGHAGRVEAAVVGLAARCAAASSSKCVRAADDPARLAPPLAIASSRSVGAGRQERAAAPRAWAAPTSGSPVVDMIDVSVRTRVGCSMAMVWAIIPPIDAPTTWAASMPRSSSSADGVVGHVGEQVRRRRPARPA